MSGLVFARYDEKPVGDTVITLPDGKVAGKSTTTDASGRFSFSLLDETAVEFRVGSPDFETFSQRVASSQSDLRIPLEPRRSAFSVVVITIVITTRTFLTGLTRLRASPLLRVSVST